MSFNSTNYCKPEITIRDIFLNHGKRILFSAGEIVFKVGDYPEGIYYIEEGDVEILIHDSTSIISTKGNVVGEMAFFSPGAVRNATVRTLTSCVLYYLEKEKYDDIVPPKIALEIMEIASKRKAEWPITPCPYSKNGVSLINIYPNYKSLIKHILSNKKLLDLFLQTCKIDLTKNIDIQEAQFGGQGSIKHVIRLGLTIDDKPMSIGLRFIGKSCFKDMASASVASRDEIEMFKLMNEVEGYAIQMWSFFDTDDLISIDDECFLHCMEASVAGIMLGEYIPVMKFCDKTSVTGININDLKHIVSTILSTWFISLLNQNTYNDKGLGMMDLKLENFVYNPQKNSYPIIDMGGMTWIPLLSYMYEIYDFIAMVVEYDYQEILNLLEEGCLLAINSCADSLKKSNRLSEKVKQVISLQLDQLKDTYPSIHQRSLERLHQLL